MPQPASSSQPDGTDSILTVSSLNKLARSLLESNFYGIAVEGEISNLAMPASGHWYLTLKDSHAQLRCAMFRNNNRLLRFQPRDGMQVIVRGRLSIYEGRGDYQLIADAMEEAGDGALRRAFDALKARLYEEGLFDEAHKKEVGPGYEHIGIITSSTGAAIRDMLSVFERRFPAIRLTLFPVTVQGNDAAPDIVRAIERANRLGEKLGLKALIISRGGGSLEDLQAFNEESVARAIFDSELPITSAVGHEIDFTISDFVADLRAPTPSAAAELMSPDQQDCRETLAGYEQQLLQLLTTNIKAQQTSLQWLSKRLKRPDRRLQEHAQTLDRLEEQMHRGMDNRLNQMSGELLQWRRSLLARSPLTTIHESRRRLSAEIHRLQQSTNVYLDKRLSLITELARSLNAISPLQVLKRGYSITCDADGQVLRTSTDAEVGSNIVSTLADGAISSIVESVEEKID